MNSNCDELSFNLAGFHTESGRDCLTILSDYENGLIDPALAVAAASGRTATDPCKSKFIKQRKMFTL